MAKIKLGTCPKSFPHTVKVQMLDGTEGTIECSFKYRTRTEYGAFIDELADVAGVKLSADDGAKFSMRDLMEKTKEANADYILKVVDGWNLDVDFNRANVAQLCDELPGVAAKIMETYRTAISDGRLGN